MCKALQGTLVLSLLSFVHGTRLNCQSKSINSYHLHCFSEGTSSNDPRLVKYSGIVSSNTFLVSTSGSMYLSMTTDRSVKRKGFLADYSIAGIFSTFFKSSRYFYLHILMCILDYILEFIFSSEMCDSYRLFLSLWGGRGGLWTLINSYNSQLTSLYELNMKIRIIWRNEH